MLGQLFRRNTTHIGSRHEPRTIEPRAAGSGEAGLAVDVEAHITRRSCVTKGDERSPIENGSCGFCGRTLLVGESPHVFEEPANGSTVMVCPICRREALEKGLQRVSQVA